MSLREPRLDLVEAALLDIYTHVIWCVFVWIAFSHANTHAHAYIHTHAHTHTHSHTHAHAYIHTHRHTHTHSQTHRHTDRQAHKSVTVRGWGFFLLVGEQENHNSMCCKRQPFSHS